jgi:serine/threonine protein kinase
MPVAFVREEALASRVPVARTPFRIGREVDCDLVVGDERVSREHARLNYVKGEYLLSADGRHGVHVNGRRVPVWALRDGDVILLTPPRVRDPQRLRFSNRMEGAFLPPGTTICQAWLSHPAYRDAANGPARFGPGEPVGDHDPTTLRAVLHPTTGTPLVVRLLPPVADATEGEQFLATMTALAGFVHPGLARVVDAGLAPAEDGARPWMACTWEKGVTAGAALARGRLPARAVVAALKPVAAALALLHRRGVLHRDVTPSNVVLHPDGRGTLIDFAHVRLLRSGASSARGPGPGPSHRGYAAPEDLRGDPHGVTTASDVYALAAVGYALLTGGPPGAGGRPPLPRDVGVEAPEALEAALLSALAPDPGARPDALTFEGMLGELRAALAADGGA